MQKLNNKEVNVLILANSVIPLSGHYKNLQCALPTHLLCLHSFSRAILIHPSSIVVVAYYMKGEGVVGCNILYVCRGSIVQVW
jgi:hypothetical protein